MIWLIVPLFIWEVAMVRRFNFWAVVVVKLLGLKYSRYAGAVKEAAVRAIHVGIVSIRTGFIWQSNVKSEVTLFQKQVKILSNGLPLIRSHPVIQPSHFRLFQTPMMVAVIKWARWYLRVTIQQVWMPLILQAHLGRPHPWLLRTDLTNFDYIWKMTNLHPIINTILQIRRISIN